MQNIPVFLPSDDNYAPYLATLIASILDNTKSFIDFYILDGGISNENQNKIQSLKNRFQNFTIEFLKIDTERYFEGFKVEKQYAKSTYNRFLIPKLKPGLEKVIYLDSDMIAFGDIRKLFEIDLGGFIIGAVSENNEDSAIITRKNELNIPNHNYFNSGTLIIDIPKWIENNIPDKLFETEKNNRGNLAWADQDCLNIVFQNNYKSLNQMFNYMADNTFFHPKTDIIFRHFNSPVKPWQIPAGTKTDIFPDLDYYWQYAKMTPFYDIIEQEAIKTKSVALRHSQIYKIGLLKRHRG